MKAKTIFPILLGLALALSACAPADLPAATPAVEPTDRPAETTYPGIQPPATSVDLTPEYPDPAEPLEPPAVTNPGRTTKYAPQPGDAQLERGSVFVEEFGILIQESYPPSYLLHLTGNLPTPCHELRAVVPEPDKSGTINVELYSVTDPGALCIQVLSPFEADIPLGSYTEGRYPVTINGEQQVGVINP